MAYYYEFLKNFTALTVKNQATIAERAVEISRFCVKV
jgi:hypothetical protein